MILKMPSEKLRVVTKDVGGGFGTKTFMYREYPLVVEAARRLGEPVSWVGDRTEHFLGDAQGRDNIAVAEMAMDENGKFLALRVDILGNLGAYLSQFAPYIPWLGASMATRRLRRSPRCTPACAASTPTPCRSTPIAAPDVPRRPICWSGSSTSARAKSASTPPRSAPATSSAGRRCPTTP